MLKISNYPLLKSQAGENFEKYELCYMLQKSDFEPSKLQLKQNF